MKNQKRIKIGYKIYTLENGLLIESECYRLFDTQEEALTTIYNIHGDWASDGFVILP